MKWITLEQYADRYKISLSLLKRKLQSNQLEYIFSAGRYKVKDRPLYEQSSFGEEDLATPGESGRNDK